MYSDYDLFYRIVTTGSLTAAGREVHLSPAMVSKRLARLEDRLGVRLINRTTRRLATTDVGQVFYKDVSAILAQTASAEARVAGRARMPCGRLCIAAPESFGRLHVAPHIATFLKIYPRIEVEMLLNDAFVNLLDERIDVAIRISGPPSETYDATFLTPNHRILCAAPSYIASFGNPQSIKDLANHALLTTINQSPWCLESGRTQHLMDVKSRVITNSSGLVRELVIAGVGIGLRSTWDISEEMRNGKLVRILPKWRGRSKVGIYALRPRATLMPVNAKVFIEHMKNVYGPKPYWEHSKLFGSTR